MTLEYPMMKPYAKARIRKVRRVYQREKNELAYFSFRIDEL